MQFFYDLSVKVKITLLVSIAALAILMMAWFGAAELKQAMLSERKSQLKYQVESSLGVFEYYHQLQTSGQLSEAQAQQLAIAQLTEMQYGEHGYFFVFNDEYTLKASLKGSTKIGSNVASTQDSFGTYVYQEILKQVRYGGGQGYLEYYFPKRAGGQPDAKLSYASEFRPWDLIVGTGVYLDDVDALFEARLINKGITFMLILSVLILISWVIIRSITQPLNHILALTKKIAAGDVTQRVNISAKDDMGVLGTELNVMLEAFQGFLKQVSSSLDDLQQSSDSLSSIAEQTDKGVQKQMLDVESVVSAVEQMTLAVKEVEQSTAQASQATQQTNEVVTQASSLINDTLDSINLVSEQVESAASVVTELEQGSSEIGEVLNVISGISEQTNLLALNAAIEAARAGEAGRGFAVVADEVRSLAHSTKNSTIEIQQMIEKLQTSANSAATVMEKGREAAKHSVIAAGKTGDNLAQVVKEVALVNDMNNQIASATTEQAAVAEEVSRSMVNISQVSQETGTGSQETLQTGHKVKQLADDVAADIAKFTV